MLRTFSSLPQMFDYALADKQCVGAESAMLHRYPIRFILFDNFDDFNEFIDNFPIKIYKQSVSKWMNTDSATDVLITYSQLAERITSYIKHLPSNDFIIAPFSEMARFYDNDKYKEFDALIKTIRLVEPPEDTQKEHQRIYIPLIGMHGKMGKFNDDPNIQIWEYKSEHESEGYTLILTRGTTYGVTDLEDSYTVARHLKEWLELWQRPEVKHQIICCSKAIFDNAMNARPDSAFSYVICHNSYEFLTQGLKLDLASVNFKESDLPFWDEFARQIDISTFDFDAYVNQRFDTYGLNDSDGFIKTWLECDTEFDRWLLTTYYLRKFGETDYVARVLADCEKLTDSHLFSHVATKIFEESPSEASIEERRRALKAAACHNIQITDFAEQKVSAKLTAIANNPEQGYFAAVPLLTPLTASEKRLMVEWLGQGHISVKDICKIYPELAAYLQPCPIQMETRNQWIEPYFDHYRASKISNEISAEIEHVISDKNGSDAAFHAWYDNFKTVKTWLHNRPDIDVYYWIDGLGVDWIPFVKYVVEKHKHNGVYLNEVMIGVADLPTRTANNKEKLLSLCNGNLKKIGDLDTFAHAAKAYPQYIVEELRIVENAINDIVTHYNGKKIAIVSDHGLTYLSQRATGLNLAGIAADHEGRVAKRISGPAVSDTNYLTLEDGVTLCALNHHSLASKVANGHGAHGGCTPEEVLVPIFIISSQKNATNYSATIVSDDLIANNPVVQFKIVGLSSIDCPIIRYNDVDYMMHKVGPDTYESERMNIVDTCRTLTLIIGDTFKLSQTINVSTGTQEDDLFDL